jgi:hypothetical protein
MGERKLAPVKAMKAVAAACQETIHTTLKPVDEAMRVHTPGGVFSVRWDERGSATALGQLAFFAEYLQATGLFERWLHSCPLSYTSPERAATRRRAGHLDAVDPGRALPLRPCGCAAR